MTNLQFSFPHDGSGASLSRAAEVVGHGHRGGNAAAEAAAAAEPVQPARQTADGGGLLHGEALHATAALSALQSLAEVSITSLSSSSTWELCFIPCMESSGHPWKLENMKCSNVSALNWFWIATCE